LYRSINCLDCSYPKPGDSNQKLVPLFFSRSPINNEILHHVKLIEKKKKLTSMNEIAVELQYVFGKHVISNIRDKAYRKS
jgi:hypothetical protein